MSILIFDSGIGGLTVLREARVMMAGQKFVYVADDAAFPYGDWDEEALCERMVTCLASFLSAGSQIFALLHVIRPQPLALQPCGRLFRISNLLGRCQLSSRQLSEQAPALYQFWQRQAL